MSERVGHSRLATEADQIARKERMSRRLRNAPLRGEDEPGYAYYWRSPGQQLRHREEAARQSQDILHPGLGDPNYLVLERRRLIFLDWMRDLPENGVRVLDVGGRLQPYRAPLQDRIQWYVAIDPVLEGLLDVVGVGEDLPFASNSFDLVLCTQVLNYTESPRRTIEELHRVLAPGGYLFLTAPALFPRYHDQRWRFMPNGLRTLLASFALVEIEPEGGSIAGMARLINLFFDTFVSSERSRRLLRRTAYPAVNTLGELLDRFSGNRSAFSSNYACRAQKQPDGRGAVGCPASHHTTVRD